MGVRALARAEGTGEGRTPMNGMVWFGGAISLALFVYLVVALVRAEEF